MAGWIGSWRGHGLLLYLALVAHGAIDVRLPHAGARLDAPRLAAAHLAPPAALLRAVPSVASAPPAAPAAPQPSGPCPAEMAEVGKYCIDRYEAHLIAIDEDDHETRHPHHQRPPERYRAASAAGVYPQAYISRREAARACEASGKRLCSWLEWKRACQGPKWHDYPNPRAAEAGACNTGKKHLLTMMFGDQRDGRWDFFKHFNSPKLNQEPGFLAKSGEYDGCGTPDGVYDLVGNLHEWVSTSVSTKFMEQYRRDPIRRHDQPWHLGNAIFMGGFFSTTTEHGHGCHFTTIAHGAKYHDYSTGFRCCRDAEPVQ